MKTYKRKAIYTDLKPFCHFAKDDHFMEVTEWTNGEGVDVTVESFNKEKFSLTFGEFKALKSIMKQFNKISKDE